MALYRYFYCNKDLKYIFLNKSYAKVYLKGEVLGLDTCPNLKPFIKSQNINAITRIGDYLAYKEDWLFLSILSLEVASD